MSISPILIVLHKQGNPEHKQNTNMKYLLQSSLTFTSPTFYFVSIVAMFTEIK